jgi:hypothetical protein
MGRRLLVLSVDTIRLKYLQRLCRSHKPSVEASFVLQELGFELTEGVSPPEGKKEGKHHHESHKKHHQPPPSSSAMGSPGLEFLKKAGCVLIAASLEENHLQRYMEDAWEINTKDSVIDPTVVLSSENLLL